MIFYINCIIVLIFFCNFAFRKPWEGVTYSYPYS